MSSPVLNELRGRLTDVSFGAGYQWGRIRHRLVSIYGDALVAWEKASPATYRAVQSVFGKGPQPASKPLPEFGTVLEIDSIKMRVDPRMSEHNIRKLMTGRHTKHERALLSAALRDDDVLMELGGGIGMVATHSALRLGPGRVFSFEANPDLESLIRDNYALNGVAPELNMCMLGPEAGTHTFWQARKFSRSSAHVQGDDTVAIEVPVRPFNDEIMRIKPSVLVVDIQGGEAELFDYADLSGVRLLLVEIHPDLIGIAKANDIRRNLRRQGFADRAQSGQSFLFERTVS